MYREEDAMAKTEKPSRVPVSPEAEDDANGVAAEIDAAELEAAKRDPVVKEFARSADETIRVLREQDRLG
jgi:hypothetical protein